MSLLLWLLFLLFYILGGDFFAYTRHEPVGVCGQIIPVCSTFLLYLFILMMRNSLIGLYSTSSS